MATRADLATPQIEPMTGADAAQDAGRPLLVPIAPTNPGYAMAKRLTDIVLSIVALIALAPIFLLIALGILITSGRPVIFRQTRLGLGGRPFTLYKFRTMVPDADIRLHEARQRHLAKHPDDPIVKPEDESTLFTPIGHTLRTTSIDELPQFWNVLRGEMSLVGPRPPLIEEARVYSPRATRRLSVVPGITCLWQVSGRSNIPFDEWVELDLDYIRRRGILLDGSILLRTIPAVLSRKGAR